MTLWGEASTAIDPSAGGAVWHVWFDVPGVPVAQGSMRAIVVKGHAVIRHDNGKTLTDWRLAIAQAAGIQGKPKLLGPVRVWARFRLQRPASHWGRAGNLLPSAPRVPDVSPDIDKLARALLDALTGVVFVDDRQVSTLVVHKRYAARDEPAGVTVGVRSAE